VKVGDLVRPKYFGPADPFTRRTLGIVVQVDPDGYYVSVLLSDHSMTWPFLQTSLELINAS
jgi:hypothetical protein